MRFWDSSALVPLLVEQAATRKMRALYRADAEIVAWWGARVECDSAILRLEREGKLRVRAATGALGRLDALAGSWMEIQPVDTIRDQARRLLRTHTLRAADSMQLAAAWLAAEHVPASLGFVCLDERLSLAAEREGFFVLPD